MQAAACSYTLYHPFSGFRLRLTSVVCSFGSHLRNVWFFLFLSCSSLARHIRAFFSGLYCVVPPSAAFILALWVNGCAAVAQPDRAQVSAESGGNHDTERDSLPPLALTSQIVFRVLAAEIAVQRNLFAPAYQTYLMLA